MMCQLKLLKDYSRNCIKMIINFFFYIILKNYCKLSLMWYLVIYMTVVIKSWKVYEHWRIPYRITVKRIDLVEVFFSAYSLDASHEVFREYVLPINISLVESSYLISNIWHVKMINKWRWLINESDSFGYNDCPSWKEREREIRKYRVMYYVYYELCIIKLHNM